MRAEYTGPLSFSDMRSVEVGNVRDVNDRIVIGMGQAVLGNGAPEGVQAGIARVVEGGMFEQAPFAKRGDMVDEPVPEGMALAADDDVRLQALRPGRQRSLLHGVKKTSHAQAPQGDIRLVGEMAQRLQTALDGE